VKKNRYLTDEIISVPGVLSSGNCLSLFMKAQGFTRKYKYRYVVLANFRTKPNLCLISIYLKTYSMPVAKKKSKKIVVKNKAAVKKIAPKKKA
jgi:hypothetical protein